MAFTRIAVAIALAAGLASCGSRTSTPTSPEAVAPALPATRWVPASPSYVFAAPTFADAQRAIRDAIDGLGMFVGVSVESAGSDLARMLALNPLDEAAVAAVGVDVQSSVVAFSEDLAPTFVARLNAPDLLQAFLDKQRARGMVSRSVIVDGIEVYTAEIIRGELDASWAIADSWLWLHFTPRFARNEGTAWFTNSRKPHSTDWARDWAWAQSAATSPGGPQVAPSASSPVKGLVGFIDPKDVLGRIVAKVPEAIACARLLEPIQRVGLAVDVGTGGTAKGKISLDLGPAAAQVTSATMPVPEGFPKASASAPISAQWNLDIVALRAWAQPCLTTVADRDVRDGLDTLDRFGIRAGRAFIQRIDLEDKSGAGVVSLDLVHKRHLASLLDEVPMRDTLERGKKFGPLAGHTIAIPFMFSFDYVLTDKLGYVAMGDGLLASTVGGGKTTPGPIAAVDLFPPAISAETWKDLFELADLPESFVDRLLRWREAHVSLAIEGTSLVLAASGTRR
ncbi:MAG: hypothetical protein ACKV2T_41920 [Kofleriaceae bacterium]